MMKIQSPETKQQLMSRLRRIEGQVRGVQKMLEEERECREILQQLAAIRSAVQSTSSAFLEQYASDCLLNSDSQDPGQRLELVQELVNLINKNA